MVQDFFVWSGTLPLFLQVAFGVFIGGFFANFAWAMTNIILEQLFKA